MREFQKLDEWELWVPPVGDERRDYSRGDDSAMTMEIRFLTKEQRDFFSRQAERYRKQGLVSSASQKAVRQLFGENVRDIKNYIVNGKQITDGGEMYDVDGDDALIAAVTDALFSLSSLDSGLAKKLRPVSDTTPAHRTIKKPGVALDATQRSRETIKAVQPKLEISELLTV